MIEIRVIERAGRPWPHPTPTRFDTAGGAIGRGADCALQLEDPDRRISRRQAAVVHRGGRYFLRQLRETCPVEVHGRILAVGEDVELAAGDEVRIGPYLLQIVAVRESAPTDPLAMFEPAARERANPLRHLIEPERAARVPAAIERVDIPVGDATGAFARAQPIDAFFEGVGRPELPAAQRDAEHMRRGGMLLRLAVQGILELLAARTIEKREFNAGATMLKARENNPLKFSPNVDAALAHLLADALPGFMPAEDAVRDAFDDLSAHQLAMLAAMRSAVAALIERIDPRQLEARLIGRPGWNALVPGGRKGQLWDLYVGTYDEIAKEIFDGESAFGRAFQATYLEQLALLRKKS